MEMAPWQETWPCVQKDCEGTIAPSAAGGRDHDVQIIDYYSPEMSFVSCHQLQVTPYCITAELCSLMLYLETKVHGKDERGEQISRQLVAWRPGEVLETDGRVSLE